MVVAAVVSIAQITALGSWARSLRWTTVLQAVALGCLGCGLAAVLVEFAWTRAAAAVLPIPVADVQRFAAWTIDPVIEEVLKVVPLLLLVRLRPREQRQLGYVDHLLLGAGIGMGFELLEAAVRHVQLGAFTSMIGDDYLVAAGFAGTVTVPSIGTSLTSWLPVPAAFRELIVPAGSGDTVQHMIWTGLAGLGIGWMARHRGSWRFLGLAPLVFVSLDHANYNGRLGAPPRVSGWISDLIAWGGARLAGLFLLALVVATLADRRVLAVERRRRPGLLLPGEQPSGLALAPLVRAAARGVPWSALVTWQFVLARRAALTDLALGGPPPDLEERVAATARQLARPVPERLWQEAGRRWLAAWRPRALLDPRNLLWVASLVPAIAFTVVGAFPSSVAIQQALAGRVGLLVLVVCLVVGLVLTALQVPAMAAHLRAVPDPSLHEARLRPAARLVTAVCTLGGGALLLVLAVAQRDPGARVVSTHALDAITGLLLVAGVALLVASFVFFPPSMGLVAAGGGVLIPVVSVSSQFVVTSAAGAVLSTLAVTMSQSSGAGGDGGSGERGPPRHTDNTANTRTYGRSVSDIRGQANRWAQRMRRRGFDVSVPPVRHGKYGHADVTVRAVKGGREYIRHFIYKGSRGPR